MKGLLITTIVALICLTASAGNWAVIVAGSNTYANYRHQSDVFHAYKILRQNNFPEDKIITFAYDDIAHNLKNPFKGKVFNKPTNKQAGVDVYQGVKIDYSGKFVTPANFIAVLEGNKTAVAGKGTERVLQSTRDDNVFLFFSDHGAPGLIAFPNQYLHADQLLKAFDAMRGHYNKLVFYLEACESGSMFTSLPNNTRIYALSAANPSESSWGYYCSPNDVVQGKHIGSCLGDLFSINFLENTESIDVNTVTLNQQFEVIQKLTTKSHVLQWGDMSFATDVIGEFVSVSKKAEKNLINLRRSTFRFFERGLIGGTVSSRFATVRMLSEIYAREKTPESLAELQQEMKSMQRFDDIFFHFQEKLQLTGEYDAYKLNFDCNRESIQTFEQKCGRLSDYGLLYVKYIAEACQTRNSQQVVNIIAGLNC